MRASGLKKRGPANKQVLIPFDIKGNMLNWTAQDPGVIAPPPTGPYPGYYAAASWKPNYEFADTMEYRDFRKGRSAANAYFTSLKDGKEYCFFLKDFHDVIPKMVKGRLSGTFTFVKRGANYGVMWLNDGTTATPSAPNPAVAVAGESKGSGASGN